MCLAVAGDFQQVDPAMDHLQRPTFNKLQAPQP